MNQRHQHLQLRKEGLILRAELERIELAQHVAVLRGPSEATYKGLRLISLLRAPVVALVAARLGTGGRSSGVLANMARMLGFAIAGWRIYRTARELFVPPARR